MELNKCIQLIKEFINKNEDNIIEFNYNESMDNIKDFKIIKKKNKYFIRPEVLENYIKKQGKDYKKIMRKLRENNYLDTETPDRNLKKVNINKQGIRVYVVYDFILEEPEETEEEDEYNKIEKILEGKEESKPTVEKVGGHYIIVSGEREVVISEDELRELKQLYCGEYGVTINQVCRKMNIPRRDFILIKTAFNITKDDVPYTDEDLKNNDIDDLVEETLEKKKDQYFIKLQQEEIKKMKKELEKYRKQEYILNKVHEELTEHMREVAQYYVSYSTNYKNKTEEGNVMVEVPIVDLHLGKLAWAPETGSDYNYKIAEERFKYVIENIMDRISDISVEKILLPIGQDFFNFDTIDGETTNGTPQDTDLRWQDLFNKGVEMLVKAIDGFTNIAPVEIILVPGNHDKMTSFYAMKYIEAWYNNHENVYVNSDPKTRKYVEYGLNLIGFTHGDKEKKRIFGNMQVEMPEAWGRTKYREFHCGHVHHEYTKEEHGVVVRRLSTVTGTDSWHFESGYVGSLPRIQTFVWDKEKGLQSILYVNL